VKASENSKSNSELKGIVRVRRKVKEVCSNKCRIG